MAKEATVADPRGLKRICLSCGTRFYDMNKRPIVCPNCETEFTGEVKVKARRGRLAAVDTDAESQVTEETESEVVENEEVEEEAEEAETVSLEDVEEADEGEDEDEESIDLDEDDLDDLDEDDLDEDDLDEDIDVDVEDEK
jgi:uncharacterized protein (TIGR02300 family)